MKLDMEKDSVIDEVRSVPWREVTSSLTEYQHIMNKHFQSDKYTTAWTTIQHTLIEYISKEINKGKL